MADDRRDPLLDVVYLDPEGKTDDPVLHRMSLCMRELKPAIEEVAEHYGDGTTMTALIALVVNQAIVQSDTERIAEALRQHAKLLDAEGRRHDA